MANVKRPVNAHKAYHAHVYFDQETVDFASKLCQDAGNKFGLRVSRVHRRPIGPHPLWSCQIVFSAKDFETFIAWLDQRRNGLSVLVHGLTGDDLKDHTDYAYWLGAEHPLNLAIFRDS